MSEQSSQERERPFLETKRILAGTAAAGVQASSVSVSPRVWGLGTIPRLHGPPQAGTKAEAGQTEERVLHNMCGDNRGPDNNWSVFWKYISRVHHRAILYDIHVREGRSVVSSPAL